MRVEVTWDRDPPGSRVVEMKGRGLDPRFKTTVAMTNSAGVASGRLWAPECTVRVVKQGHAVQQLRAQPGETTIRLEREFPLRGRVVDDFGRPVAGARIDVGTESEQNGRAWCRAETDEHGEYVLTGLQPRSVYRGAVTAAGHATRSIGVATAADAPHDLDFTLVATSQILVTVTGDMGVLPPSNQWSWRLQRRGRLSFTDVSDFRPAVVDERLRQVALVGIDTKHEHRVTVRVPGFGVGTSPPIRFTFRNLDPPHLIIALARGRHAMGTVVDEDGRAIAGACVSLTRADRDECSVKTDDEGRFTLTEVPLDDTSFFVRAPGFEEREVPFMHGETSVDPIVLARERSE